MLALYHLASAKNPEKLPGLADMFKDVGVAMLPMRSKPVVFVSEAMIGILEQAAPCVILLDEVVAYARNLEGIPYDGFVSFLQSLTEAANASRRVGGRLDARERRRGRQSARSRGPVGSGKGVRSGAVGMGPAQGTETFEIIRRLFQEMDLRARKLGSRPSRRSRATTGTMRASFLAAGDDPRSFANLATKFDPITASWRRTRAAALCPCQHGHPTERGHDREPGRGAAAEPRTDCAHP
jgi:hypothetical protein